MTTSASNSAVTENNIVPSGGQERKVLVVGAGVIGLTTAIRLRERGHEVLVVAQETPSTILQRESSPLKSTNPGTYTSSGSGGLWMPFLLNGEGVERWSTVTHAELNKQVGEDVGVDVHDAFILKRRSIPTELPWYGSLTKMTVETHATDPRVPAEYQSALRFYTPIVQMRPYLTYLEKRALALGVVIELTAEHTGDKESTAWTGEQVADFALQRFAPERPVVVNCCGILAGKLADDEMVPGRGVMVYVARPAGKRYMISEDDEEEPGSHDELMAYCIPRGDEYALGGTCFIGDWRETPTDEEVQGVKERADKLIPGVGTAEQTGVWAGLRPTRSSGAARVEVQGEGLGGRDGIDVIANYGHGGSGVTTCWGCADEVVRIVAALDDA